MENQTLQLNQSIPADQPVNVVKTILVSLGLVLLGVFLGVITAKFYSPTPPTKNDFLTTTPTTTPSPTLIPTPTAITVVVDETTSWKTYTDPKGNFIFKYPPGWKLESSPERLSDPSEKYSLGIQTESTQLDVNKWTKENVCTKTATASDQNGCGDILPGPIENSLQTTFLAHYTSIHTVVKNKKNLFDISLYATEPNLTPDKIKVVYNKILSTFKFTNATTTPAPTPTPTIASANSGVSILSPLADSTINSPVTIKGTASNSWVFEGVLSVFVEDGQHNTLAGGAVYTKEVTGTNKVSFETTIDYSTSSKAGFITVKNDNPSGLPENDKSFSIPVKF